MISSDLGQTDAIERLLRCEGYAAIANKCCDSNMPKHQCRESPHCVSSCAMQRRAGLPKSAMVINLRRGLAFELHIDLNFLHGFEDYIEYKEPCGARR
jgi:hypothetical protein